MAMSARLLSSLMFLNFGENISTATGRVVFRNRLLGRRELYFGGQHDGAARRSWVQKTQRPASPVSRRCEWLFSPTMNCRFVHGGPRHLRDVSWDRLHQACKGLSAADDESIYFNDISLLLQRLKPSWYKKASTKKKKVL